MARSAVLRAVSIELNDNKSIFDAARFNDVVTLMWKIQNDFEESSKSINDLSPDGKLSALHYAVRYGHIECIKLILKAEGVDVNVEGKQGARPIHFAAKFYKEKWIRNSSAVTPQDKTEKNEAEKNVIQILLDHGADINAKDDYGFTALRFAAQKGSVEALTILLNNKNLDIEQRDSSGATALHAACLKGRTEVVKVLIENGADIQATDLKGRNALHYSAVGVNGFQVLKEIFRFYNESSEQKISISDLTNVSNKEGETLLHLAIDANSYDTCKLLIDYGAFVNNRRARNKKTPLHVATSKEECDPRIVQLLVENGADVNCKDSIDETPLHKAARANHKEIVQYLLEKGAIVDSLDMDRQTALIEAASKNNLEILKILLKHGAKVDVIDRFNKSSIFWAAEMNAVDVIEELLPYTDDTEVDLIQLKDSLSHTPLHIAAINGHIKVVRILLKYGAEIDTRNYQELTPLHSVASIGHVEVAKALISSKRDIINDRTGSDDTALHLAATKNKPEMLEYLLKDGAEVDLEDNVGLTPLSKACINGHLKCVEILLKNHSYVDSKDLNGRTPMFLACIHGHHLVLEKLIEYNADLCALDTRKYTMLDIAIENRERKVVEILLQQEKFFDLMKHSFLEKGKRTTPMKEMIVKLPDLAYLVLNKCMDELAVEREYDRINREEDENCVEFNYELIDDTFRNWNRSEPTHPRKNQREGSSAYVIVESLMVEGKIDPSEEKMELELSKEHPLHVMCREENKELLSHPLVTSLISQKWEKFGRPVFYSKFAVFVLFIFFVTCYLIEISVRMAYWEISDSTKKNLTCIPYDGRNDDNMWYKFSVEFGGVMVLIIGSLQLLLEVIQMINRRLSYFIDLSNWLECAMNIICILYAKPNDETLYNCNAAIQQRAMGAIAAFLVWMDLLLFMRKFPSLGIYVVMFCDVLKTFTKFSLTFAMFIMSFALGFYSIFTGKVFRTIGRTFVKSIAMTIGEFGFDDIFGKNNANKLPEVAWILFFLFLIVMTILLMNMLVGLAVDDIKAVLQKAVITRLIMQVQLVLEVENMLPSKIRKKFFIANKRFYLNEKGNTFWKSRGPTLEEIQEAKSCAILEKED